MPLVLDVGSLLQLLLVVVGVGFIILYGISAALGRMGNAVLTRVYAITSRVKERFQ